MMKTYVTCSLIIRFKYFLSCCTSDYVVSEPGASDYQYGAPGSILLVIGNFSVSKSTLAHSACKVKQCGKQWQSTPKSRLHCLKKRLVYPRKQGWRTLLYFFRRKEKHSSPKNVNIQKTNQ